MHQSILWAIQACVQYECSLWEAKFKIINLKNYKDKLGIESEYIKDAINEFIKNSKTPFTS